MKKFLTALLLLGVTAHAQQIIGWPGYKKAVIVLTYDDALTSQLKVAVPQLDSAGLKATFFLTGNINSETIPQWRAVAKRGFELANHSLFHPCAPVSSNNYTPDRMIREIDAMNHLLFAVDGVTERTYAYPCTETAVGGKDYTETHRKCGLIK